MKLCLSCASIIDNGNSCSACGSPISRDYDIIVSAAKSSVEFGILYRNYYESQLTRNGEISSKASIVPPDQWLVFIGIAALSGIVGNASYDLIKSVIRKIISKAKREGGESCFTEFQLESSHGIEIFIEYIREYNEGMPNVSPEVRSAIVEEILIHGITKGNSEDFTALLKRSRCNLSEIANILREAQHKELSSGSLHDLWDKMIDEESH